MRALALSLLFASAVVVGAACGGAPKQAEVVDPTKDTGSDMAGEETGPKPKGDASNPNPTADEEAAMHKKCCGECKTGQSKDRSGSDPKTVPCADYTADLSPWCLEHFRGKPTMAADCSAAP